MATLPLQPLFDAIILLTSQYRMEVPLLERQRTIRHTRLLITKIIHTELDTTDEGLRTLRQDIVEGLKGVRKICAEGASHDQNDHLEYCLREVKIAFELADQIAKEYESQRDLAHALIEDLPVLRPFDYGTPVTNAPEATNPDQLPEIAISS